MAEAAALAGLRWVASPIIHKLVNDSISYLGSDIAKGLDDLETTVLPQIQLSIEAAQHSTPYKKARLAKWLARLKNAYFDAEAILHDLEYKQLKRKAKGEDKKLLRKLLRRLKKLKEIAAEADAFRDLLGIQENGSKDGVIAGNSRSVTSSLLAHKVFGRDGDRDEIINFLLGDRDRDGDHYSVVAITGMGGAGKTTLAQYIYNDPRVKKHFPSRLWLCISPNSDIIERTKEMIECISKEKCPDIQNLSVLQNKLLETLPESDNIMVVLDDVWYDREAGENQWDDLLKPFSFRGVKCKIVVTSRSSWLFPNALQPGKLTELSDLGLDDFTSLLRYHAIDGLQINNPLKNDLSDIVDQIATKISKSPLAAMVVGNQLRQRPTIRFWQSTLENVTFSDTMEILLWSFNRFDVQLQRCFLFCSIFPKGVKIDSDSLVSYWIALDFIQPSNDKRNVEDIGLEYFEIMIANSIFHPTDKTHKSYTMHDLFHDLAEKLSAEDCFRVTNAERKIPSTVQHVYLEVDNENLKANISSIGNLSNLRTLILGNSCIFIDDISEIIPKIPTKFRNLRVLDVWRGGYKNLPLVVGDFRNLRFLGFWKSSFEELPDSVLHLYHLQFLQLPFSVKTLPTKLSNLIKLRSITMYSNVGDQVNTLPPVPYLCKLTSLQCLNEYHVRKEEGYELHQLGPLKEIGGSLRIVHLGNVRDKNEAVEAKLIDKPKLKRLDLVWVESAEINCLETEVIEALRPPAKLESLTIDGYSGSTYPSWLQENSFIKNIKDVKFYNCNALTILPPNLHEFRHCSVLIIENIGALRELSTFPENLARLSISKCPSMIFVCNNELQMNENQSKMERNFLYFGVEGFKDILDHELKSFKKTCSVESCVEHLQIMESAERDNAPQLLVNLNVNRAWWYCHQQRMKFIFKCSTREKKLKLPSMLRVLDLGYCCVSDEVLSDCLRGMTTLEELYLEVIMTITTLPPAQVLESLQSLRVLDIKHCWYLRSLGGLHALPHLERFLVEGCWCLEMENGYTPLPSTLQYFSIRTCTVPQAIFNSNLPCLHNVEINNCFVSRSLSFRRLTVLKTLVLLDCPHLFSIGGLESRPFINTLQLFQLPNLDVESVVKSWQGCRELYISSSVMLNKLLSSQDFVSPRLLCISYCQEEVISFEKSDHFKSIKKLGFFNCKTKSLPKTLSDFSNLEQIGFKDCPEISELPELPGSVDYIVIKGCPMLRKRCQPNGPDWHKIQCIQDVKIE
ncbi:disease resistance protein RGA2-like isoform X2 [Carex rostrata]